MGLSDNIVWRIEKPSAFAEVVKYHIWGTVIAGAILLATFFVVPSEIPLRLCMFYNLTHYPCMTCGFTRAFCALSQGRLAAVIYDCPLAVPLYVLTWVIFVWNGLALISRRVIARGWLFSGRRLALWWAVLISAGIANWIYRLMLGLD